MRFLLMCSLVCVTACLMTPTASADNFRSRAVVVDRGHDHCDRDIVREIVVDRGCDRGRDVFIDRGGYSRSRSVVRSRGFVGRSRGFSFRF